MITLTINKEKQEVDAPADTPLLWVLRDILGLTGTKFGCAWHNAEPVRST
jgi:isoquinoline 1-oxidoreductase alpha subunit